MCLSPYVCRYSKTLRLKVNELEGKERERQIDGGRVNEEMIVLTKDKRKLVGNMDVCVCVCFSEYFQTILTDAKKYLRLSRSCPWQCLDVCVCVCTVGLFV